MNQFKTASRLFGELIQTERVQIKDNIEQHGYMDRPK